MQLIFPFAIADFWQIEHLSDNSLRRYLKVLQALDRMHWSARSSWDSTNYKEPDRISQVTGEKIIALVDECPYAELTESPLLRNLVQTYAHYRW